MTMLFIDGFSHYATADIPSKYTSVTTSSGSPTIASSSGPRGGGSMHIAAGGAFVSKTFTAGASFVFGFRLKLSAAPAATKSILRLLDAGSTQVDIRINSDLTISVTRNGTALTTGTSTNALTTGVYHYIEWKVTIANSIGANSCQVRVDGDTTAWVNVTTGQDTQATANASANSYDFGKITTTGAEIYDYADFYFCNQSGGTNNDFLGDSRVDTSFPTGDGNYTQWTPSTGSAHYSLVNGTTPQIVTNVADSTIGNIDCYDVTNLPSVTGTIFAVQECLYADKTDAGARSIQNFCRSGVTDSALTAQALATSALYYMGIFETDPANGAWTETTFNAAQFGEKTA